MKIIAVILISFFLFSACIVNTYADEQSQKNSNFHWSLETRCVYSSGISDPYTYNRTGATATYKFDYIGVSTFIDRYFNYQITDGNGVYEYHSFSEAGASLNIYILNMIDLAGGYSRGDDFNYLKKDNYNGSIEIDINLFSLIADYSYEKFEYQISSNNIENIKKDYSFELDYMLTDSFSIDISYMRSDLYFNFLGYDYYTNIVRAGLMHIPYSSLFLLAGISAGRDSDEYNIYGADCGIAFLIYSRFKLSFTYNFDYYDPTQTESSGISDAGTGGGNSNQGSGSKRNPYLSAGAAGEAYSSHTAGFGITVTF